MRRVVLGVTVIVVVAAVGVASFAVGRHSRRTTSPRAEVSTSSSSSSTSTTTTLAPSATVRLPVLSCPTSVGGDQQPTWQPQYEAVTLPPALEGRLAFYSNGLITVMAPAGGTCSGGVGADGSMSLIVVRAGQDSSGSFVLPPVGGVLVRADYTGHGPGESLVCGYFPRSAAARAGQPCDPPTGAVKRLTPDVVTFARGAVRGLVVYPQVADDAASVNVDVVTCNAGSTCGPILSDALARFAPAYTPQS